MKVLGMDKNRRLVEKYLSLSEVRGAYLIHNGNSVCIEPNLEYFKKLYRPWDGADGFTCAFIMVTNKCNKKCSYCYEQKMKVRHYGDPSVYDLIGTIQQFVPNGIETKLWTEYKDYNYDANIPVIRLIGGEPTVFPQLSEFLNWLKYERNNQVFICTNGLLMQDPAFFKNIPKSPKFCWALSIDSNTTDDFIKRWADNVLEYTGNSIAFSIGIDENNWKTAIHQDQLILDNYHPEEIRYRGISEQDGSKYCTATDVIEFITESRGIQPQTFIDHAKWHQQTLTCLSYKHTGLRKQGNVIAARLPVWNTLLAEEYCKMASFTLNTKRFWNTAEGHCSSIPLFIYRMQNHQRFNHPSHSLFWDKKQNETKVNPFTRKGY